MLGEKLQKKYLKGSIINSTYYSHDKSLVYGNISLIYIHILFVYRIL